MTSSTASPHHPGISRPLTFLFAIAGGTAVGNLYWAQPLLAYMAASLNMPLALSGLLVTMTQVGYTFGIFLIVPLGDTLNRRTLIPSMMICAAIALLASALAPTSAFLLVALTLVGITTVTGQLLTPLAIDLARDDQRGWVVSTVGSGLLIGILISRTLSGLLAHAFGWRAIYFLAAAVTVVLAIVLRRAIPEMPPRPGMSYPALIRSVFTTIRAHRSVQVTLLIGGTMFSVFSMFWTALTFLLSAPPFNYSVSTIGLVGLSGLAGVLASSPIGRLHSKGLSAKATGVSLVLAFVSILGAGLASTSIIWLLIAIFFFDVAMRMCNVLNQTRVMLVDPKSRSRLNTAFVTSNFIGAAIGSTLAGLLWHLHGWFAVTAGELVMISFAFFIWAMQRRHLKG